MSAFAECFALDLDCWVGLQDATGSGAWELTQPTLGAGQLSSLPWASTFPPASPSVGGDAARFSSSLNDLTVQLTTAARSELHPFICERAVFDCPAGFSPIVSSSGESTCARLTAGASTFTAADSECSTFGAVLASVSTSSPDALASLAAFCPTGSECWLGTRKAGGVWFSQDWLPTGELWEGEEQSRLPWAAGEPDASGVRVLLHADSKTLRAIPVSSTQQHHGICVSPVHVCPSGTQYVQQGVGQPACAKLQSSATWANAATACAATGGQLATPRTESEARQLRELCGSACWTSLNDGASPGIWAAAGSHRLPSDTSGLPWAAGEPALRVEGSCAELGAQSVLRAEQCGRSLPSLCLLPPEICPAGAFAEHTMQPAQSATQSWSSECKDVSTPANAVASTAAAAGASSSGGSWILRDALHAYSKATTHLAVDILASGYADLLPLSDVYFSVPPVVPMRPGGSYKWVAQYSTVGGDSVTACSPVFVVDTTRPLLAAGAGVREVDVSEYVFGDVSPDVDRDYTQRNVLSWQWNGFFDSESSRGGLLDYQFCVTRDHADVSSCSLVNTGSPTDTWIDVAPVAFFTFQTLAMVHASTYTVHMKASNRGGLFTILSSDNITYDNTAPVFNGLRDGVDCIAAGTGLPPLENNGDLTTCDIDFQNSPDQLHVHWPQWTEDASPIVHFTVGVGSVLGRPTDDIAQARIVPAGDLSTVFQLDYSIRSGTTVYTFITAINAAGLSTTRLSDGVMIDTIAPEASASVLAADVPGSLMQYGTFGDNPAAFDADSTPVLASAAADHLRVLVSFLDSESCLATCEASIGTDTVEDSFTPWTALSPEPGPQHGRCISSVPWRTQGSFSMPASGEVHAWVRCHDRAGNVIVAPPQLLAIEQSRPSAAAAYVNDINPLESLLHDTDGHSQLEVVASWGGWDAGDAVMVSYLWGVTTTPPPAGIDDLSAHPIDVLPLTFVGSNVTAASNPSVTSLVVGSTYYVVVRGVASNGLWADVASDGFVSDTTPPDATNAVVRDTATHGGPTVLHRPSQSTATASWSGFTEDVSSIVQYQYAIRWCGNGDPGLLDVRGWTDVTPATATSFTATGLAMQNGLEYCFQIRAVNPGGLVSAAVESAGAITDSTPPIPGVVYDGDVHGVSKRYTADDQSLTATWLYQDARLENGSWIHDAFYDPDSQVDHFECCAGTSAGACDTAAVITLPASATQCTLTPPVALVSGVQYFVTVTMYNRALVPVSVSSDGVVVDTSAPVLDGDIVLPNALVHAEYISSNDTVLVDWSAWRDDTDAHSRDPHQVLAFKWSIGIGSGDTSIMAQQDVGFATFAEASNLPLVPGQQYTITVVASAAEGAVSAVATAVFTPDTTAPVAQTVTVERPAHAPSALYVQSTSELEVRWAAFLDAEANPAHMSYFAAVGTSPYAANAKEYEDYGAALSASITGLSLTPGVQYFVSVVGENPSGLRAAVAALPVVADDTAPLPGSVFHASRSRFQTSTSAAKCAWERGQDPVSSIAAFDAQLMLQSSTGSLSPVSTTISVVASPDTVEQSADFSTSDGSLPVPLENQKKYVCSVTFINGAGLTTTAVSQPIAVVTSGPVGGVVLDGPATAQDADFLASCSVLRATWKDFSDASGIHSYAWWAGTSPGADDVLESEGRGEATWGSAQVTLPEGVQVFVTVQATNFAGLSSTVTSSGATCDESGPLGLDLVQVHSSVLLPIPVAAPTGRDTCLCSDEHAVFVPDFEHGGGGCFCGPGFVLNVTTSQCTACAAPACKPSIGNDAALCGTCPGSASDGMAVPSPPAFTPSIPPPITCPAGEVLNLVGACVACPLGTFKAGQGNEPALCLPCAQPTGATGISVAVDTRKIADGTSGITDLVASTGHSLDGADANTTPLLVSSVPADVNAGGVWAPTVFVGASGRAVVSLVATNAAGLSTASRIVTQKYVTRRPTIGAVWDVALPAAELPLGAVAMVPPGIGTDAGYTANGTAFSMRWSQAVVEGSFIQKVECLWGTSPGSSDVGSAEVSRANLQFGTCSIRLVASAAVPQGTSVFGTIVAHAPSSVVSKASTGLVVDVTAPDALRVALGPACERGTDALFLPSARRVQACWVFLDTESGAAGFTFSAGLRDAATMAWIAEPVGTGRDSKVTFNLQTPLQDGQQVLVEVNATNAAGLVSSTRSAGATIQAQAPHVASLQVQPVGHGCQKATLGMQSSMTHLAVQWTIESAVALDGISLRVGSELWGGDVIAPYEVSSPGLNGSASWTDLALLSGHTYFVSMEATSAAGIVSRASTNVLIDGPLSTPIPGVVALALSDEAGEPLGGIWSGPRELGTAHRLTLGSALFEAAAPLAGDCLSAESSGRNTSQWSASLAGGFIDHVVISDASEGIVSATITPFTDSESGVREMAFAMLPLDGSNPAWQELGEAEWSGIGGHYVLQLPVAGLPAGHSVLLLRAVNGAGTPSTTPVSVFVTEPPTPAPVVLCGSDSNVAVSLPLAVHGAVLGSDDVLVHLPAWSLAGAPLASAEYSVQASGDTVTRVAQTWTAVTLSTDASACGACCADEGSLPFTPVLLDTSGLELAGSLVTVSVRVVDVLGREAMTASKPVLVDISPPAMGSVTIATSPAASSGFTVQFQPSLSLVGQVSTLTTGVLTSLQSAVLEAEGSLHVLSAASSPLFVSADGWTDASGAPVQVRVAIGSMALGEGVASEVSLQSQPTELPLDFATAPDGPLWISITAEDSVGLATRAVGVVGTWDTSAPGMHPGATPRAFLLPSGSSSGTAQLSSDVFLQPEQLSAGLQLVLAGVSDPQSGLQALEVALSSVTTAGSLTSPAVLVWQAAATSPQSARIKVGRMAFEAVTGSFASPTLVVGGGAAPVELPAQSPPLISFNTVYPGEHGMVLNATVTAVSGSGSTVHLASTKVVVDGTPPVLAAGSIFNTAEHTHATCLIGGEGDTFHVTWAPAEDDESPVQEYEWCLGTDPASGVVDDVKACASVGMATHASALIHEESGLVWPGGRLLYVTVRARNAADLWSEASGPPARALCDPEASLECEEDSRHVVCMHIAESH